MESELTFLKKCSQIIFTARVDQGAEQGTTAVLWQSLNSGAAPPGVCLGGSSSPVWSISVSWQPVAPSLPAHQSFLSITTWIWVLCTWIQSCNTQKPPGQLDPGAPDPLTPPPMGKSDGVNLPSHYQLEGVMGWRRKEIALLNFSLSSRNPYNGFRSAWMYLDALRWFCDFFFCKLTVCQGLMGFQV